MMECANYVCVNHTTLTCPHLQSMIKMEVSAVKVPDGNAPRSRSDRYKKNRGRERALILVIILIAERDMIDLTAHIMVIITVDLTAHTMVIITVDLTAHIMTDIGDDRVLIMIISTDQETILFIEVSIGQFRDNLNIDSIVTMPVYALDSTLVIGSTDPIREVFRKATKITDIGVVVIAIQRQL